MSADGETRRDGFFGWLFAMLATMSLLPLGFTSTGGPSSAKPKVAEESDAAGKNATDADDAAESTSLDDAIRQALGFPKSPKQSDRSKGPPCPDPLAVIATLGANVTIEPLVLCVADPETSAVGFRFDLQIDALQKALGAHGYALDRWSLPWEEKKSVEGKPGLLVFRKSEKKGAAQNLILVYLVGEWITSGIDREAFRAALLHIKRLEANATDATDATPPKSLPILGPVFTGTVDSLGLALQHDATIWPKRDPVILNYSAMKVELQRLKDLSGRCKLPYGETVLGTQAMWKGLVGYLETAYGRKPKIALLNESGTTFGIIKTEDDRTSYPFPAGISKVRDAYEMATSGNGKQRLLPGANDGAILRFPSLDKKETRDVLPRFDAGMQAPYAELALRQILLDIARNDYDVVGITATDHRDRVFLGQQIRRYAPRAQLVLLGGDLAYEHPDYRQTLRGTIVASTYPMFPTNQQWSFRQRSNARHVFANQAGYALFNAVSAAMVIQRDPKDFDGDHAILTVREKLIPFVEYGPPHDDGTSAETPQPQSPPLWISVLGDQGVWPVHSTKMEGVQTPRLITVKSDSLPAQGAGDDRESSMPHDIHDTHPFSLCFILLLQAVAAGLAFLAAGGFLPLGRPAAANADVPAWSQPMREWWSNPDRPDHYDSAKARRLFVPMLVGLLALWLQVFVFAAHQRAIFALDARQSPSLINGVEIFLFMAGLILVWPGSVPVRVILGCLAAAVGCGMLQLTRDQRTPQQVLTVFFAILASLSAVLLLHTLVDTVARRLVIKRYTRIGPSVQVTLAVAAVVANAVFLFLASLATPSLESQIPWLTTTSWILNGVSPLLPLIAACLGIEVLCLAELMRCWLIETSFVGTSAGRAGAERRDTEREPKEKDELSYPVSGMEALAIAKQGLAWLLSRPRTDGKKTSAAREPAPHAYLLWIGFGLFVSWLVTLFCHVRPVYPNFWINVAIVALILFGYLSWSVIFVQLLALRFRFFKQLRAFQHEVDAPQSRLAAGFEATRSPRDVWLGRLLYASQDSVQAGASAFDPAEATESAEEGDLAAAADAAARRRAIGIKHWVAFVGAQMRITIFGLGFGAILLFVAISSLPFQPRPWFQFTATLSFVAIGIAVVTTFVSVEANEVLSRIAGTTAGKVSFDWALIAKLAPWVVIPLVMVIGQTFPELWNWFGVALESWRGP